MADNAMDVAFYFDVSATDEFGETPDFARVIVNEALFARIREIRGLLEKHGLSEARTLSDIEWVQDDDEDDLRIGMSELVVIPSSLWWTGAPRQRSYYVETKNATLEDLEAVYREAVVSCEPRVFFRLDEYKIEEIREILEEAEEA